jgi:hypothetical protein
MIPSVRRLLDLEDVYPAIYRTLAGATILQFLKYASMHSLRYNIKIMPCKIFDIYEFVLAIHLKFVTSVILLELYLNSQIVTIQETEF